MPLPVVRGATGDFNGGGNVWDIVAPSDTQAGDLLIFTHVSGGNAKTLNSGYTLIRTDNAGAGSIAQTSCYTTATVAGAQTYIPWSDTAAGNGSLTVIQAGTFNTTTPINAHAGSTAGTALNNGPITASVPCVVLGLPGVKYAANTNNLFTPPTELTELYENTVIGTIDVAVGARTEAAAGTYDYNNWVVTEAPSRTCNHLIAVAESTVVPFVGWGIPI